MVTVKKIKLRDVVNDKIFREVSALSRLNHRFIVRYYTTWVEASEGLPMDNPGEESEESDQTDETNGLTSKPKRSSADLFGAHFTTYDLSDLDSVGTSRHSTFPSIHFSRSSSQDDDDDQNASDSSDDVFEEDEEEGLPLPSTDLKGKPIPINGKSLVRKTPNTERRTLYIQMVCSRPLQVLA